MIAESIELWLISLLFLCRCHISESSSRINESTLRSSRQLNVSNHNFLKRNFVMNKRLVHWEPLNSVLLICWDAFFKTPDCESTTVRSKTKGKFNFIHYTRCFQNLENRLYSSSAWGWEPNNSISFLSIKQISLVGYTTKLVSESIFLLRWLAEKECFFYPKSMIRTSFTIGLSEFTESTIEASTVSILDTV